MAEVILETKNEEGDSVTHNLHVEDEHVDDERGVLTSLAERAEEAMQLRSENETLRDALVSETIRIKKLAGELGEDSVEDEREFLEGLPASRLKKHYDRALELDVDTEAALEAGKDVDDEPSGDQDYEELGL